MDNLIRIYFLLGLCLPILYSIFTFFRCRKEVKIKQSLKIALKFLIGEYGNWYVCSMLIGSTFALLGLLDWFVTTIKFNDEGLKSIILLWYVLLIPSLFWLAIYSFSYLNFGYKLLSKDEKEIYNKTKFKLSFRKKKDIKNA